MVDFLRHCHSATLIAIPDGNVLIEMHQLLIDGNKIKGLRAKRGFTQQATAERAGLTASRLRMLEKGGANVRLDTVARLATTLDVHPFDLLRWARTRA
jgi:DNA-binding Xre family transcriptional regulator